MIRKNEVSWVPLSECGVPIQYTIGYVADRRLVAK